MVLSLWPAIQILIFLPYVYIQVSTLQYWSDIFGRIDALADTWSACVVLRNTAPSRRCGHDYCGSDFRNARHGNRLRPDVVLNRMWTANSPKVAVLPTSSAPVAPLILMNAPTILLPTISGFQLTRCHSFPNCRTSMLTVAAAQSLVRSPSDVTRNESSFVTFRISAFRSIPRPLNSPISLPSSS